jgi:type I restriction enzyme R subunit
VAEVIENNVRKLIIDESPINPKYYEKMSELLDALIEQRKHEALDYAAYLAKIVELTKQAKNGPSGAAYPPSLNTVAKRAVFDNLGRDEALALAVDQAVRTSRQDDWRGNSFKIKKVRLAIKAVLEKHRDEVRVELGAKPGATREGSPDYVDPGEATDAKVDRLLELIKNQNEY